MDLAWTSAASVPLCGVRFQGSIWLNRQAIQFDCLRCAAALDIRHLSPDFHWSFFLPDTTWTPMISMTALPNLASTPLDTVCIAIPP